MEDLAEAAHFLKVDGSHREAPAAMRPASVPEDVGGACGAAHGHQDHRQGSPRPVVLVPTANSSHTSHQGALGLQGADRVP